MKSLQKIHNRIYSQGMLDNADAKKEHFAKGRVAMITDCTRW